MIEIESIPSIRSNVESSDAKVVWAVHIHARFEERLHLGRFQRMRSDCDGGKDAHALEVELFRGSVQRIGIHWP